MAEPFIAEVRIFAGNFAPRGWAFCDGQLLPISQNTALFSIVGTTYGGDGRNTLRLPELRGRAPMHWGNGPGLTPRQIGESGGTVTETLTEDEMPAHNHSLNARSEPADAYYFGGPALVELSETDPQTHYGGYADTELMASQVLASTGGGQAHNNMQPHLGLNFIIALIGLYPSRN